MIDMKRFVYILLLISPLPVFSQHFIGKTKAEIKKELPSNSIRVTDTTLSYILKEDDKVAEIGFSFTKEGKCMLEMIKARDENSYQYFLNAALSKKDFDWKKADSNNY